MICLYDDMCRYVETTRYSIMRTNSTAIYTTCIALFILNYFYSAPMYGSMSKDYAVH